jgi:hypothetical protein
VPHDRSSYSGQSGGTSQSISPLSKTRTLDSLFDNFINSSVSYEEIVRKAWRSGVNLRALENFSNRDFRFGSTPADNFSLSANTVGNLVFKNDHVWATTMNGAGDRVVFYQDATNPSLFYLCRYSVS